MSIYHLSFEVLKRSEGKSSCYLSAYNTRSRIVDQRTGIVWDYTKKSGLDYHEILLPENSDQKYADSDFLWNHIEGIESRKDSQLSKYFDVAIPLELSKEEKIDLVKEYCYENFTKKNIVCDISFHDLDSKNPHAHVMTTLRPLEKNEFGKKIRNFKDKDIIYEQRSSWAELSNKYLKPYNKKISHKSLSNQKKENEELAEQAFKDRDFIKSMSHIIIAESLDREPMSRIHRNEWRTEKSQNQRSNEQLTKKEKLSAVKELATTFLEVKEETDFTQFKLWLMKKLLDILSNIRKRNKKSSSYNKQTFKFMTQDQKAEQKLTNAPERLSIASREDLISKLSKHTTDTDKIAQNASDEVDLKNKLPKLK